LIKWTEYGPFYVRIWSVTEISVQDLKARLSAAIAEAEAGETLVITRHRTPVAQLGPPASSVVRRGPKAGRGRLLPALTSGTRGRALAALLEDRGDR
jgi:antitoxin (DNA-binding transcriptional repressor) of toxin-antitoxin stability system